MDENWYEYALLFIMMPRAKLKAYWLKVMVCTIEKLYCYNNTTSVCSTKIMCAYLTVVEIVVEMQYKIGVQYNNADELVNHAKMNSNQTQKYLSADICNARIAVW